MRSLGSRNRKLASLVSTLAVTVISGGALIAMATGDGSDLEMSSPVVPEPGTGLNSGRFDDLMSEVPVEPGVDGRQGSNEPASADVPVDGATKGPKVVKSGRTGALNGIPRGVFPAYRAAATTLGKVRGGCGMTWPLLAGIGKVESDHASGGRVDDNGLTRGTLIGPVLDGAPGLGTVRDTDDGKLDEQHTWDRPVGPMQITPTVWREYAVDGNADERRSPNNVYDASATVGVFLCSQNIDLRDPRGLVRSLLRYNHSTDFVATVLRWMRVYSRSAVGGAEPAGPDPRARADGGRRSHDRSPRRTGGPGHPQGQAVVVGDHDAEAVASDGADAADAVRDSRTATVHAVGLAAGHPARRTPARALTPAHRARSLEVELSGSGPASVPVVIQPYLIDAPNCRNRCRRPALSGCWAIGSGYDAQGDRDGAAVG